MPATDPARDQAIALAGLFQSLALVQDCARSGGVTNPGAFDTCVASVLRIDAASAAEVYAGTQRLRPGLNALLPHLERRMNHERLEQAHYAANVFYLERRLDALPDTARQLQSDLAKLASAEALACPDQPALIDALAALYQEHISPLGPRILVRGEPTHLKQDGNAARIRTLLLAAVRAAALWRHCGGGRFGLLLRRRRIAAAARALLDESAI